MRDVIAAATGIIKSDNEWLQTLALRDPDAFRDVAAALIARSAPSPNLDWVDVLTRAAKTLEPFEASLEYFVDGKGDDASDEEPLHVTASEYAGQKDFTVADLKSAKAVRADISRLIADLRGTAGRDGAG